MDTINHLVPPPETLQPLAILEWIYESAIAWFQLSVYFWASQFSRIPPPPQANLAGKTVVVTGANRGLGLAAAKHFARMNPERLILACRSEDKGIRAVQEIARETGYIHSEIRVLDQSSFSSVSAFVDKLEAEPYGRVDILLANAGLNALEYVRTKDGWENSLQVNHLSTSLLALRLLPLMHTTARVHGTQPRITVVSSDLHLFARVSNSLLRAPAGILRTLSSQKSNITILFRYNLTKLFNVFFTHALVQRLPDNTPVVVNAAHPGYCVSTFSSEWPWYLRFQEGILSRFVARSTDQGASVLVWAATAGSTTAEEAQFGLPNPLHGAYVVDAQIGNPSQYARGKEGRQAQDRVWEETIAVLREVDPKIGPIVDEYLTGA